MLFVMTLLSYQQGRQGQGKRTAAPVVEFVEGDSH